MSAEPPDGRTAADERLDEHFDLLREDPPAGSKALSHRIARTARWQASLRAPLRAVASLLGAAAHGLASLFGGRSRTR